MSKQKYPQSAAAASSSTSSTSTKRVRANYSQVKTHAKQDRKRKEAYERQDRYDGLTLKQQLASCIPNGSKRQRARLEALIALEKAPKISADDGRVAPAKKTKKVA